MKKSVIGFLVPLILFASFGSVSFSSLALADDDAALSATMKDMAHRMVLIRLNAADASQDDASAGVCDKLLSDISDARGLVPPKIAQLPQNQQAAQIAQYQQALDHLSEVVSQLKSDFLGNNASAIQQDLSQIEPLKLRGHKNFKD